MRIDKLEIKNFKKFESLELDFPRKIIDGKESHEGTFHIIIGENGTGKTSILDALAIALGVWLIKVPDSILSSSKRAILSSEKRITAVFEGDRQLLREVQGDVSIKATGRIDGIDHVHWEQHIQQGKKKSSSTNSKEALKLIQDAYHKANTTGNVTLPILAYYGAGRTWIAHNERSINKKSSEKRANRWSAFYDCLNDRIRISDLNNWFESEAIARGSREGKYRTGFEVVKHAVTMSIPEANDVWYDGDLKEIVFRIGENSQPFSNLSAGQRTVFALVADIAMKAVIQNNFLVPAENGSNDEVKYKVIKESPGVVLIDEIDVHLHPKWQRQIVEILRSIFPKIQFIATTHSPFIIQSLREEELINLQGETIPSVANIGVEEIAKGLMGVVHPEVSERYSEMVDVAKNYFETLEEAVKSPKEKLEDYKAMLADKIAPYADNPAFQAFLEMKRVAKIGC